MHRTQILLEEWQYETLRARAEQEGRSLSDLIRDLLRKSLTETASRSNDRLDAMEGVGEDAGAYGEHHDRFLYGAKDGD